MITLTNEQVTSLIEAAVVEKGENYIYERPIGAEDCLYVHGEQPGCIVGHVLHAAGVRLAALWVREGMSARVLIEELKDQEVISMSGEAVVALRRAQQEQDYGGTWGEALQKFNQIMVASR